MVPGSIWVHNKGKAVGVVGDDGYLHTHNMSLPPEMVRNWTLTDVHAVPEKLEGFLAAARRRSESNPEKWRTK